MTTRAMTLLNEQGDTTLVWEEEQDDEMIEIIRRKMAEGITFFTIEPRFLGILPPKRTKITDAEQARDKRAVAIPDADFRRFVETGAGTTVKTPEDAVRGATLERDPEKVAKGQSVGVRQMRGG
jgi:hypothetical protein